jgi:4-diphosphocytidyl-2-C-methyl-D-erythritol kinase
MITLHEKAYAKLNLTLDVLGLRDDGYHDLKSVMQTVSLCDDILLELDTGKPWQLICDDASVPCDRRNLAWKAAECFINAAGISVEGLSIHITKRIPSQAGMGGGSSDAAAVMRALNRHYGMMFSVEELAKLSEQIGSDVPFCVYGGTAMCEGRGERIRKLPDMPACPIVICKPDFSLSTPVLFRRLDEFGIANRPDNDAMEAAICDGDLVAIGAGLCNVFDPVVSSAFPLMDQVRACCMAHGALGCQMSGSGSAFFALMPDDASADALATALKQYCPYIFVAYPV